jgi:hypothetical protein
MTRNVLIDDLRTAAKDVAPYSLRSIVLPPVDEVISAAAAEIERLTASERRLKEIVSHVCQEHAVYGDEVPAHWLAAISDNAGDADKARDAGDCIPRSVAPSAAEPAPLIDPEQPEWICACRIRFCGAAGYGRAPDECPDCGGPVLVNASGLDNESCLLARLKAAVAVLDAITTPDGELHLPTNEEQMARLQTAFAAAKKVP